MTDQQPARTLWLQFDADRWTGDELEQVVENVADATPADTGVVLIPDSIETMDATEVKAFRDELNNLVGGEA